MNKGLSPDQIVALGVCQVPEGRRIFPGLSVTENLDMGAFLRKEHKEIEEDLIGLTRAKENKGRICILRGYDQQLASQVYAAGDFFLIPSRYEPCGLTDYIAQLFGNPPIVHNVGGLVKVQDGKTGFAYIDHSSAALMGAMQKAMQVYRSKPAKIKKMQQI